MRRQLRVVLALLTVALGCGGGNECPKLGETRCSTDDRDRYPHGAVYEYCGSNFFDPKLLDWQPANCYALGDGSGPFNCGVPNTVCWSGYCYCGS